MGKSSKSSKSSKFWSGVHYTFAANQIFGVVEDSGTVSDLKFGFKSDKFHSNFPIFGNKIPRFFMAEGGN